MNARSLASRACALLGLCLLAGCSQAEVTRELRSLQGSEDSVFLCRDGDGNGRPMSDCPDRDGTDDEQNSKRLYTYALVTETITNEIAVVDVTSGHVVDMDPSVPGYGFLRVGGRPTSIATTPGGTASFVATTDVGQNGIFALPTNCLSAPKEGEPQRDLTTWPACRLDDTPGEIAMLVEPTPTDAADPSQSVSCDGSPVTAPDIERSCYSELAKEGGPAGTRKLVVALPERGELAVLDAQEILDTVPGTFPPCHIEKRIPLVANVPAGVVQTLPPDLETTCAEVPAPMAPPPSRMAPRPAGLALSDDNRLYVADSAAPVVHVLNTSSVCGMSELPSLLPMSLREPWRVVTTGRVAVSPLTPSGRRFVYAIDSKDQLGASVMAFDVSPGSTDPTPIVRTGSPELPSEPSPDRLWLGSSARDVAFAYRDLPYADPITGIAQFGTACDPDPAISKDSPAGLARSSSDYLSGARPSLLRGLFGFVLQTNGVVGIVDVEDFDGPCRRPKQANTSNLEDFRGCSNDQPAGTKFYTEDGTETGVRTVTDEVSCRVVEPHRFRGGSLAINDPNVSVLAPSLRGFPQLSLPQSAAGSRVEDRPRLLGVPFEGAQGERVDSEVFVGSTPYSTTEGAENPLPVDPNGRTSEEAESLNALVLPPLQPRAYAAQDAITVTFEGPYGGDRSGGFLQPAGSDGATQDRLVDQSTSFCTLGTYDVAAMTDYGMNELKLDQAQAEAFARDHADYVQITSALLDEDDSWWNSHDRQWCIQHFGPDDVESLAAGRDFRVLSAFADQLLIEPRSLVAASDAVEGQVTVARAKDCFPGAIKYRLRTSNQWTVLHTGPFVHDIVASGADNACVRSCNPLKKWAKTRAFEISSRSPESPTNKISDCAPPNGPGDPLDLRVGCAQPKEIACVYSQTETAKDTTPDDPTDDNWGSSVRIGGTASECIFDGLTARFAIYRGRLPSVRDEIFTWQTAGGFSPLVINLANVSNVVSPQSFQFVPQLEQIAVVDGSSLGLTMLSLDTFGVVAPSPFF